MGNILQKLHFTKSETRIILLLTIVLASGLLLKLTKNFLMPGTDSFDYSRADRVFGNYVNRLSAFGTDSLDKKDSTDFSQNVKEITNNNEKPPDSTGKFEGKKNKKGSKEEKLKGRVININSAPKEELMMLPGIGESTAEKILMYRKEHNGFRKIEDIQKIKGIGKKKFEKLKPYISTE